MGHEVNELEKWQSAMRSVQHIIRSMLEKPAKILVVDDDPNDLYLLCRELDGFYCSVTCCQDTEEALLLLKSQTFDYVVIDQKMPKISGLELIKRTMRDSNGARFFMVSGFQDSGLVGETLKLGALYLPKPVTKSVLATFLRPKDD